MRSSSQPRVRQFLDRVAEPEVSRESDYLEMLTDNRRRSDECWKRIEEDYEQDASRRL